MRTGPARALCCGSWPGTSLPAAASWSGWAAWAAARRRACSIEQHLRFFQAAYGVSDLTRAYELLEELNFSRYRHERAETLSGGTRQKLNLVLALMHDPQVLLLDEPYQGFDWETYLRFWDLAAALRNRGCAVLVVSHLAYDASRLDILFRLDDGVLRATERTATVGAAS